MIVYPVITPIPTFISNFERKLKKSFISLFSRRAVRISSIKSELAIGDLLKDTRGVPLLSCGFYWSVTHKERYVGGVLASTPVGIDIEIVRKVSNKMYGKIANSYEWSLCVENQNNLFFRYWTAKEAVLKAESVGLLGLSNCLIEKVIDEVNMVVRYGNKIWYVENFYFNNYIAAIALNNFSAAWSMER